MGENLELVFNDKKWKFLHKIICCGNLLESPPPGDSNRLSQHMILWRTNDNYAEKPLRIWPTVTVSWVRRCSRNVNERCALVSQHSCDLTSLDWN